MALYDVNSGAAESTVRLGAAVVKDKTNRPKGHHQKNTRSRENDASLGSTRKCVCIYILPWNT